MLNYADNFSNEGGMTRDSEEHYSTRIRRPNEHDTRALANGYAGEDSDRGYLARQVLRLLDWEADEDSA